ncbi:protein kinase [Nocardia huaxiensis]|uniref:non-specific serine/threonine protein kinase n=1 Tax=Nocardia huaxiensis TaxID=2755382 RepID=A0A7D6ZHB6_9NOCA|nr:serine/threonine-protein kinase [Nocardia huaxiensis]QLY27983.1 protein kinase [Nocardia huaxiensis]
MSVLVPGTRFAGYRIEGLLGTGGMGTVYRARHPTLSVPVALKVLRPGRDRRDDHALFRREARLAAQLDHPNIVAVRDFGEEDGIPWMAMQFVRGRDAAALLRTSPGGLDPARAVHIVSEAAKALDHAHENQVIHRDIKPANIFLAEGDNGLDRVLVGDFGIARSIATAETLTRTGFRAYSEPYAPPEQRLGLPVDARADVHALGVTLHELLTGHLPGVTPAPAAHRLTAPMRAVTARATAAEPGERYASCGELAAAARAALHESPRPRPRIAATLTALGVVAAAILFALLRSDTSAPEPAAAPVTTPSKKVTVYTVRCEQTRLITVAPGLHTVVPTSKEGDRICIIHWRDFEAQQNGETPSPANDAVRALQDALKRCEAATIGDAAGLYLKDTRNSVVAAQHKYAITEDGIFGPKTSGVIQWPYFTDAGKQFDRCGNLAPQ